MQKNRPPLDLAREDLMEMEGLLCEQLSSFLSFSGHALYFPTSRAPEEPQLLTRERRLLLPLRRENRLLGVFMLHGVKAREARPLLPFLPAIVDLGLENLARAKAMRTDSVTGIATEQALFAHMENAAERLRAYLEEPNAEESGPAPLHWLCMGLVLLRLGNGDSIVRRGGHAFAEAYFKALADACREALPSDVLAARVGRWEIALLFPASGRGACHKLARAALTRMEAVRMPYPVMTKVVHPRLCAGHALYPQDMRGTELHLAMYDQARMCMDRARMAANVAGQEAEGADAVESRIMPFARILQEGGMVLEILPLGRLRLSIGRQAKAREGMRFALWGRTESGAARYKGELVLLHTRDTDSVAEALHLEDVTCQPEVGDRLTLLGETPVLSPDLDEQEFSGGRMPVATGGRARADGAATGKAQPQPECVGGLCGHGDFLNRFGIEAERRSRFALCLLRLEPGNTEGQQAAAAPLDAAHDVTSLQGLVETALGIWRAAQDKALEKMQAGQPEGSATGHPQPLAGRYGSNSLVFFHPDVDAQTLVSLYQDVCNELNSRGILAAAGLAGYPLLQYSRAEMPECALKALEYALLLPDPKVGVCNSLAFNISADRRYSLGDVFGAVEEYKLALLADEANAMAWNSLGVCMAALGRQHEARRHFMEALRHGPDTALAEQIYYNLGTVCQGLGEKRAAAQYYRQCVKISPEHQFAHIRLGQLCELGGRRAEAKRFYEKAAALEDARPGAPSLARRHLARVAVRQRKGSEARELLHEALVRNPQDAASMLMLANIYLDSNEDPAMAELLARKSAGLHDRPEAWQALARALRKLGREEEARVAEAKAVLS
ncbi:MAG: tetratricopeptide repeat protein [Desulfovibrio sp.]|uniref:tetratricopeptide repeat protein n=1 Tax=Desulfovibrio sp. TaxID=885 RepID=UPI00135F0F48|nr:tetratricopeptide repeat protein [Desulfovibrio sp.]MTJ91847.1 tetratricopeptide repeat protein [Desulfovibrio sp.]